MPREHVVYEYRTTRELIEATDLASTGWEIHLVFNSEVFLLRRATEIPFGCSICKTSREVNAMLDRVDW